MLMQILGRDLSISINNTSVSGVKSSWTTLYMYMKAFQIIGILCFV